MWSNGPLFISPILSHFVSDFASQNDKVQFDYLVALDIQNDLSNLTR
jgi:hypothetical protein